MSRTLQQLRTDVNSLQSGLKELYSLLKISPDDITVPSWRYPEKTATSVRVQIKECDDTQLLLELIVDRLMLVLQSCVLEMDRINSTGASGIPLSLSSTVRKFTQGFCSQIIETKQLNETVGKLTNELSLLQDKTSTYHDIIINQLGTTALPITDLIPEHKTSCCNKLSNNTCKSVSTQTLQTSMAIDIKEKTCLQCSKHLEDEALMIKAINTLQRELIEHFTPDGNTKCTTGKEGSLQRDLALIRECFTSCKEQTVSLKEKLHSKDAHIIQLENQYSQVMANVNKLQEELKNNQRKYEYDIRSYQTTSEVSLNELKSELSQVSGVAETLRKEVISLRKTEAQLEATLIQKKEEILTLQTSFKSSLKEKEHLQRTKKELNEFIVSLKKDYNIVSQELHEKSLELNKTSTQLSNMENRCKYLQSKQLKLLTQVDEMDQNCTHLNELLNAAVIEKDNMNDKLTQMTERCTQTLDELQKEKLLLEESNKSNDAIQQECHQLQEIIKTTQEQLKEERDKTQLLMDYPYRSTINNSANSKQSRQHIDANSVRILLLEEQNFELRRLITPHPNPHYKTSPILEPIKLWDTIPISSNVNHTTTTSIERLGSASSFNSDCN